MLGSYGDVSAIPLLIEALDDSVVASSTISALLSLSSDMPEAGIVDEMVRLMETPRDHFVVDNVINILEELGDPRVATIGLDILDHPEKILFDIPRTVARAEGIALTTGHLRMQGAFAFAKFAQSATDELVARLTHPDAQVRAAATAALRKDPKRGPHLGKHLKPLLDDPDIEVRHQAEMTMRFFKPSPKVEIPPERMAEIQNQVEGILQRVASVKKKNRF